MEEVHEEKIDVPEESLEGPIENDEDADPSVPSDLLELHMALEDNNMTLDEFKAEFGL